MIYVLELYVDYGVSKSLYAKEHCIECLNLNESIEQLSCSMDSLVIAI